jgi:hypothetical protein
VQRGKKICPWGSKRQSSAKAMSDEQAIAETSATFHRFAPIFKAVGSLMAVDGEGAGSGEPGNTGGAFMVPGDGR